MTQPRSQAERASLVSLVGSVSSFQKTETVLSTYWSLCSRIVNRWHCFCDSDSWWAQTKSFPNVGGAGSWRMDAIIQSPTVSASTHPLGSIHWVILTWDLPGIRRVGSLRWNKLLRLPGLRSSFLKTSSTKHVPPLPLGEESLPFPASVQQVHLPWSVTLTTTTLCYSDLHSGYIVTYCRFYLHHQSQGSGLWLIHTGMHYDTGLHFWRREGPPWIYIYIYHLSVYLSSAYLSTHPSI